MNVFTNYTMKGLIPTSLNGNHNSDLFGFGIMSDFNTSYYVLNRGAGIIFLSNDNYDYVTKKTFLYPTYMVTINSNLYITENSYIWKTDKYLNVSLTYNESGSYRGIYYNCTENLIYAAPIKYNYLRVFNLNLTLNHTVNVSTINPCSEYKNELYVGTRQGLILVIISKTVMSTFTGFSSRMQITLTVADEFDDEFGLIAISYENFDDVVNLYYYNGTFTGKQLATPSIPNYIGFDSKGHFVLIYQVIK
jgi:hypothetical protein